MGELGEGRRKSIRVKRCPLGRTSEGKSLTVVGYSGEKVRLLSRGVNVEKKTKSFQ